MYLAMPDECNKHTDYFNAARRMPILDEAANQALQMWASLQNVGKSHGDACIQTLNPGVGLCSDLLICYKDRAERARAAEAHRRRAVWQPAIDPLRVDLPCLF